MESQPTKTTQMSYIKNGPFFQGQNCISERNFNLNTKEGSISMTHTVQVHLPAGMKAVSAEGAGEFCGCFRRALSPQISL
jgi:hypothetical protein